MQQISENDELIVQAIGLSNAGYSIIPIFIDHPNEKKIKSPALDKWTIYQTSRMFPAQIEKALKGHTNKGIGLACGYNGTYAIDWDGYTKEHKEIINKITAAIADDMPEVYDKIYIERTMRGGTHWILRHEGDAIKPNRALVRIKNDIGKYKKLVESKGAGGYVVIAPSRGYTAEHNDLTDLEPLTTEEYKRLMTIICSFNEEASENERSKLKRHTTDTNIFLDCPFQAYKERETANMLMFLESRGWKMIKEVTRGVYWLSKPNRSNEEVHGVLSMVGDFAGHFKNFSTDADIPEGYYNAVDLMLQYEFNNNKTEFTKWAVKNGYGKFRTETSKEYKEPEDADLNADEVEVNDLLFTKTPTLSDECINQLPKLIRDLCEGLTGRTRDMVVIHALGVLSSALFNVRVKWGKIWETCNLYTYIIAPASSGKGICGDVAEIVDGIDQMLLAETKAAMEAYTSEKAQWDMHNKGVPFPEEAPKQKELVLTSDNTSAGIIKALRSNDIILVTDTEGDTMNKAIKSKHGDFLDTMRKCYNGELIGANRAGEGNFKARNKFIALAIASTKNQAFKIFGNAEDGTISRVSFFGFRESTGYIHPNIAKNAMRLPNEVIEKCKDKVLQYYAHKTVYVIPSHEQDLKADKFGKAMIEQCNIVGEEAAQIAKRTGLQFYRIAALIANIKRCEENNKAENITIDQHTWNAAKEIINAIYHCNLRMFVQVADREEKAFIKPSAKSKRFQLLDVLPDAFTYTEVLTYAKTLDMSTSTAKRALKAFLEGNKSMKPQIKKLPDGSYLKIKNDFGD